MSPSVCERVDIQIHVSAKVLNKKRLLIIEVSHLIPGRKVCIGRGRGRRQLFHERNERIQPSESNTNKTSPSVALSVGVPHYA